MYRSIALDYSIVSGEIYDSPMHNLFGFLHGAEQFSPCSIFMSTTVEEHFSQFVAVELVNRPEADPNGVFAYRILPERDRQPHPFDFQRFIDQPLSIALDIVEAFHLLFCQSIVASMASLDNVEFLAHDIPPHSYAPLAEVVVNIPVYFILVETTFLQQHPNDGCCQCFVKQ